MARTKEMQAPRAYAWALEDGSLCHWAEPYAERLKARGRPSPAATTQAVRLVPEWMYRQLMRCYRGK